MVPILACNYFVFSCKRNHTFIRNFVCPTCTGVNLVSLLIRFWSEIDDDDGNDILNYSGTTESYSVPNEHDSDETVDYPDADDQEGN